MKPSGFLRKQFSIAEDDRVIDESWMQTRLDGVTVNTSPDLPVTRVVRDQETVGIVLGWFSHAGVFHGSNGTWTIKPDEGRRTLHRGMAGRFLFLETTGVDLEVSTDSGALLAAVWSKSSGVVASTSVVLGMYPDSSLCRATDQYIERLDRRIWFPFGLTPYQDVERLLPGHTWSLAHVAQERIPYAQLADAHDPSQLVEKIANAVVSTISAVGTTGPYKTHLTAGRDSRMVLAAAIAAGHHPGCVTIQTGDPSSTLDVLVASQIARLGGLSHLTIPFIEPPDEEITRWIERTGNCVVDAVTTLCRTVRQHDDGVLTLAGACGEVGRSFYWRSGDIGRVGLDPADLITRLGFQPSALLEDRAQRWIDGIQCHAQGLQPTTRLLDLAYIENRLGGWAGPSVYGHEIGLPTLSPFNQHSVFEDMMALPEQYRFENRFSIDFIAATTPELLSVPFNRVTGVLRFKFWKQELTGLLSPRVKDKLRSLPSWLYRKGG